MTQLSLDEEELRLLEFILHNLLRGSNPAMATRHRLFSPLYKKVLTLKTAIEEREDAGGQ